MSEKTAVVVLADPSTGTEEALGRVFNALATAWEYGQGGDSLVLFQGAGTRWPAVLADPAHPANELYTAVKKQVATVAPNGCATVFGATEGVAGEGIEQVGQNHAPGTPGVASLRELERSGYRVLVF
ncbi:hypothetical protein LWC33_12850 [Pseudonocardia sp. RS11V-5]|uniref:hypothetical protein n=1 Tax=Pseudonocardia terrae TaxID=2905831 RepID=UPI001E5A250D|nr:hypothetical protein [Pseudonocardia terrae]MCE3552345.1 hypothetical protein [Pseudonocardia terrae]